MSRVKTSTDLIDSVKTRAMLPEQSSTFKSEDYLNILNEEFQIGILPKIMEVHEEYYVYTVNLPINTDGSKEYTIPSRAVGNKVRNVQLTNSNGGARNLTRIEPEQVAEYIYSRNAFYLRNNKIVLLDEPNGYTYVSIDIFLRPNALVADSRGAKIKTVTVDDTAGTTTITMSKIPSHFGSLAGVGDEELFDFVEKATPNKISDYDLAAVSVSTTQKSVVFNTADLIETPVVGNYIVWAEETIVPQIPFELIPILCQMGAVFCLESLGDAQGLALAEKKLEKMKAASNILIDNRTEGTPQKVVNRNSFIGRGSFYNKRGR